MHWQTYTAAACVFVTLLIFVYKFVSPKKKPGCGHDCGCGKK
jgi:hypothetical protein